MIGLEVHVQLNTKSKLFCTCATQGSPEPNTRTCPICLGHPGSRPMVNKLAIDYALRIALALGCSIAQTMQFSRKTYFYPDLAKNYQITQYEQPLGAGGQVVLESGKVIRIRRVHVEEDPAALVHADGYCLVDYNRSGLPLVEVVTEPDMVTPADAREFLKRLLAVLKYVGVFDVDHCVVKADANVSVKERNFLRVEVKNITGFKEIERAVDYEIRRQREQEVIAETRGWDAIKGLTRSLRMKESEDDYGYIIDPDIPPIDLTAQWINMIKTSMPELGHVKVERYVKDFGIDRVDAQIIAMELDLASLFEKVIKRVPPVLAARWIRKDVRSALNKLEIEASCVEPELLTELLELVGARSITDRIAQELLALVIEKGVSPAKYVKENNLGIVADNSIIISACTSAINENQKAVADFKAGRTEALDFLFGKVMNATKGKVFPGLIKKELARLLQSC